MADDSLIKRVMHGLGLSGSNVGTNSLLNPAPTPAGRAKLDKDFRDAGEVANPDIWARYSDLVNGSTTYEQALRTWEEMAGWDLLAAALTEIVDEALQTSSDDPATLWYECSDSAIEKDCNEMLENITSQGVLESQVWHTAALGNHFEKINYSPGEGVTGLTYVHPSEIRRYWLQRNRRCIGFRWVGHTPDRSDLDGTALSGAERISVDFGNNNKTEELWYPWDFMHIRRMYRTRGNEHGEALFGEAQGIYKKLRMALDQMVVYRAQIQPDRYVIQVDTAEQVPAEQMRTLQRWKQMFRKKVTYGDGSGANNQPTDFKSFYNPLALDTVLWLAQPKGFTNSIIKLSGTTAVPDVYDIEMLSGLFFSILGMPKQWITGAQGGEGSQNPMSGKALIAQDIRFLRKIKAIRRPIKDAYKWLGYFHCLLKHKPIDDVSIRVVMSNISGLEEQVKLETTKAQIEVINSLGDMMEKYKLPREEWIELVFKKYMHLPSHVVDTFITALPVDVQVEEAVSKRPVPRMITLVRMMEEELGRQGYDKRTVRESFKHLEEGGRFRPRGENKPVHPQSFVMEKIREGGEIVQSSFGNVEQIIEVEVTKDGKSVTQRARNRETAPARPSTGSPLNEANNAPALPPSQRDFIKG